MNLVEGLARECVRVAVIRSQCETMRNMPGVNVVPLIELMSLSIENALKALGDGVCTDMVAAIQDLNGYSG